MFRLTSIAAAAASLASIGFGIFGEPAFAQSQSEIAAKLNDEGKELMYGGKYAEASAKFAQAVGRVPEAKYFFNLCTSRFQEGNFGEALTACNAVANNNPTPELRAKADKLIGRVKDEAKKQGIDLQPAGGGGGDPTNCQMNPADPACATTPPTSVCQTNPADPACAQPGNPTPPSATIGRPPPPEIFKSTTPDNKYTWTLGVDLFGGGGKIGQSSAYGTTSTGLRIKGDYMLNPAQRFGAQGYLQISHFGQGDRSLAADTLDVFDVGIALYKHLCLSNSPRLCLTPLAGVQIALMSPANATDGTGSQVFNYAALGGRLEIALQYAFGQRFEHVLGFGLGVNLYSAVFADPASGSTAMEVGLDKGGAAGYFGIGYTYRFNTPLGSSPFVTLE
jgi:hypothetical protein